jgi:hypothetical protein
MLVVHAMKGSMKFALHGAGKHDYIAVEGSPDTELMSGNGPLVPQMFW